MNELSILNGFKVFGTVIRVTGENESGKLFNVELSEDDFAAYFEVDQFDANKEEEDVIRDATQSIYDSWTMGRTSYEVCVAAQKLRGYAFKRKRGGFDKVCKYTVGHLATFLNQNDYVSYTPIYS